MSREAQIPGTATQWLVASNLVYLGGGFLAYSTKVSVVLVTALACALAVPGLLHLKQGASPERALWTDRAMSGVMGTWAMAAVLVLVPFIAVDEGHALWHTRTLASITILVSALGMLAWNWCAFHALGEDAKTGRMYAAFHGVTALAAVVMIVQGDGTLIEATVRGQIVDVRDLRMAPALSAVPGLIWAAVYFRAKP